MFTHSIETCPDDLATLRERLDHLANSGERIVSVLWQPHRVDVDQAAAYDASGSYVIIVERNVQPPLRAREPAAEAILPEVEPLA